MFKSLTLVLILKSFLLFALCEPTRDPMVSTTSCFTQHNISNFSTFPTTVNNDSSSIYYNLLNFSIHNLRFTKPNVPKPVVIILPESQEQLANTVLCCREALLEIRVRCGGHSYEGTSSVSIDGSPFVIIDLMNLNRVRVDLESETAWVEGGATLGETYYAIAESSQVHGFSAGSCPTVGIGGHISGGGFGLLSRKYGLAADNVVDALLVDAEGRLLDRKAMGEDVFWAIRGGGGGVWGIVYAWKIHLSNVPQMVTAFVVSRTDDSSTKGGRGVAELVHKWQYVAPNLQDEFYLSVFVGAGLPDSKKGKGILSATFKGFYLGPKSEVLSVLDKTFPELGIVENDCKEMSWIESVLYFSGLMNNTDNVRSSSTSDLKNRYLQEKLYFKAKSDYVRTAISKQGINTALEILEKEPRGYVILDPYGGMMQKISSESIAFPHRKGNLFTIQYLVDWTEKVEEEEDDDDDGYIDWIRGFYNSMTPYVSWGPRAAYVNYVDLDLGVIEDYDRHDDDDELVVNNAAEMARIWGEKYFLNNYDRLVRAKTLIDPSNVFCNQQGIPPMYSSFISVKEDAWYYKPIQTQTHPIFCCLSQLHRNLPLTGVPANQKLKLKSASKSRDYATEKLGIKIQKNPPESKLSDLGVKKWPKWGCPPSKFPWTYSAKETCYLLEGKVKVQPNGSDEFVEIGAGDLVEFPKGMSCTWDVSVAVDKHYNFE